MSITCLDYYEDPKCMMILILHISIVNANTSPSMRTSLELLTKLAHQHLENNHTTQNRHRRKKYSEYKIDIGEKISQTLQKSKKKKKKG